jgi:hypothetical protein
MEALLSAAALGRPSLSARFSFTYLDAVSVEKATCADRAFEQFLAHCRGLVG